MPSLALLAAQFLLHVPPDVSAPLRMPLISALAPWAMTHQHAPRAMAVMVLEVQNLKAPILAERSSRILCFPGNMQSGALPYIIVENCKHTLGDFTAANVRRFDISLP